MSLIRQIVLLLAAVLLLALGGGVAINLMSARQVLQTQLTLKNSDNAQSLALALSQQRGDAEMMGLLMAAQFDTGFYRRIVLRRDDARVLFERSAEAAPTRAPAWFVRTLAIESSPGLAQVSDGWRALGTLEVVSHSSFAHDQLWRAVTRMAALMVVLGVAAVVLAALALRRMRAPLRATVAQAQSLVEGRYVLVDEPHVPELRQVAQAMNAMVRRVQQLFEAQSAQVETLRRAAHCDALTGLPHRTHFLDRLATLLQREDGVDGGGLVLVRLARLPELNLTLGRETTDRALRIVARVLEAYPERVADCFVGRLNGSDFALCLPHAGVAAETAQSIANALRSGLGAIGSEVAMHAGAVELQRGSSAGALMAQADLALARAEAAGPFAVELIGAEAALPGLGERSWRAQMLAALEQGRCRLMSYPTVDRHEALIHLESPMRIQLDEGATYEVAARWLPMAVRNRLTPAVDLRAVALALDAVASGGEPRAVNIAAASLADSGFAPQLKALLTSRAAQAGALWLEFTESAALEHFEALQDLSRMLRPLGVKIGLEHAGQRLHRIERLYELGIDYAKLDAAVCVGVARNEAAQDFVRSSVTLLGALAIRAFAEGVADADDARALWACGITGITGPWVSAKSEAPVR